MSDVRTYRGRGLEELIPKIRAELGDDAVILRQREALEGGVGGFFAKRVVEVDAMRPQPRVDVRAGDDEPGDPVPAGESPSSGDGSAPGERSPFAQQLAAIEAELPPAPAHRPVVDERVAAVPGLDDLFPETGSDRDRLAALFRQGAAADPVPEPLEQDAAVDPETVARLHAAAEQAAVIEETPVPEPPAPAAGTPPAQPAPPAAATPPSPPASTAIDAPQSGAESTLDEPALRLDPDDELELVPEADRIPAPAAGHPPHVIVLGDDAPAALELLKAPEHREAVVALTDRGLSPELATDLVAEVVHHVMPLADPETGIEPLLRGVLAARIPVASARRGGGGRVLAFVGPAGAGKTRCVAGLAVAYARRSPLPVACLAFRPKDGGAELQRLLSPAGVPVHVEDDADRAAALLGELREDTLVLVDTPGVAPTAEAELRVLARELRTLGADELHLTVPAPLGPETGRELVEGTRELGPSSIVMTHSDATRRIGTVVELAAATGLPLSYVGRGTSLQAGLRPANAEELALALLP